MESRGTCGGLITREELQSSSQDFAEMIASVATCGDGCGANLSKKSIHQSSELIENLHKGGHLHGRTYADGPSNESEPLNDPCKLDIETSSVDPSTSYHSKDLCVTISDDTAGEDTSVGAQHGSSQLIDGVDLLHGLPRTSSGFQVEDEEDNEKKLEENEVKEPVDSSKPLLEEDDPEQECPICTEFYDTTKHKQSLLNCNHIFCDNCIKTMVNTANSANLCRVTCPICRQTTPMLEWEVRKMQEQMMESGGVCIQQDYVPPQPLVRRPGLCGALEYRFQKRFRTGRLFLFPPCIRHSHRLIDRLSRLERRCRCLYFSALVFLLCVEFFCFALLFLPIVVIILMIVFCK
ncbi:ring finger protein-like [Eleutherodactylus coqui]|uniref:ring finger protein-like n=1 Tax=Eleutherodactylus coqui TaxID=57060 RepID=UPI003462B307